MAPRDSIDAVHQLPGVATILDVEDDRVVDHRGVGPGEHGQLLEVTLPGLRLLVGEDQVLAERREGPGYPSAALARVTAIGWSGQWLSQ
jgi:hypothetical protein